MERVNTMSGKVKKMKSISGNPLYIGSEVFPTHYRAYGGCNKKSKI